MAGGVFLEKGSLALGVLVRVLRKLLVREETSVRGQDEEIGVALGLDLDEVRVVELPRGGENRHDNFFYFIQKKKT